MAVATQTDYETRVRPRYGVIAFAAAVLIVASQLVALSGPRPRVSELTLYLIVAHKRATQDIIGAAIDALGLVAVGVTLHWLHGITHVRRPEARHLANWLSVTGAGLSATMALAYRFALAAKASDFVTTGNQSYLHANHLVGTGLMLVLPLVLELGALLLALGCIWVSLNAMRVGLLTRPTGYAGVVAGALFVFPLGVVVPIAQGLWLVAVAVTMAARWPNGDPPAWKAGQAMPWTPLGNQGAATPRRGRRQRQPSSAPRPSLLAGLRRAVTPPRQQPPEAPPREAGTPKRRRRRQR